MADLHLQQWGGSVVPHPLHDHLVINIIVVNNLIVSDDDDNWISELWVVFLNTEMMMLNMY